MRPEAGEVTQLVRIGLKVVKAVLDVMFGGGIFFGVRLRGDDRILPAAGADSASDLRLAYLDEDPLWPPPVFAVQQRKDGATVHLVRDGQTGGIKECRGKIQEAYELLYPPSVLETGPQQHDRHADRALVRRALVLFVARLEVVAMVGSEHDEGILAEAETLEGV